MRREDFDTVITSGKERYRSSRRELWAYRDLVLLLVLRDFVSGYKQTVLGPAWAVDLVEGLDFNILSSSDNEMIWHRDWWGSVRF